MPKQVKIIATSTGRVTDALCAAAGFLYQTNTIHCIPRDGRKSCHSFRDEFYCQGYHFKSRRELNEWMVAEINGWMGENNLVKWTVLEQAHSSHGRCYPLFQVC